MTAPYIPPDLPASARDYLQRLSPQQQIEFLRRLPPWKPEPSRTTLVHASQKGSPAWDPRMSPAAMQAYRAQKDPVTAVQRFQMPLAQVADDTAAPLTQHLAQWFQQRQPPVAYLPPRP